MRQLIVEMLLPLFGNSCPPGLGLTMKMHNGNDEQDVASDLINDSIWKAHCPAAPCSLGDQRPSFRIFDNSDDGCLDLIRELKTKAVRLSVIVVDGPCELCLCWFKKLDIHRGFLPTCSKISLAEIALISP